MPGLICSMRGLRSSPRPVKSLVVELWPLALGVQGLSHWTQMSPLKHYCTLWYTQHQPYVFHLAETRLSWKYWKWRFLSSGEGREGRQKKTERKKISESRKQASRSMTPRTDPEMNTDSIHTMQISTCPASTKSVVTKTGFWLSDTQLIHL